MTIPEEVRHILLALAARPLMSIQFPPTLTLLSDILRAHKILLALEILIPILPKPTRSHAHLRRIPTLQPIVHRVVVVLLERRRLRLFL